MKKLLFIIFMTFLFLTCAHSPITAGDKWDNTDKLLLISLITLNTIDCLQTNYIFDSSEYYETNSTINEGVKRIGEFFVPLYFITATIFHYLISDHLDSKYRKFYLGIYSVSSYSFVRHNFSLGIGFSF